MMLKENDDNIKNKPNTQNKQVSEYSTYSNDEYSIEDNDEEEYDKIKEDKATRCLNGCVNERDTAKNETQNQQDIDHDDFDETGDMEDLDSDEDDGDRNANKPIKKPFMLLVEIMLNPVNGWKHLRRSRIAPEKLGSGLFYPLAAISSASCFIECLYDSRVTLSMAMISAVKVFIALFFGYFVSLMGIKIFMIKGYKDIAETPYCKEIVMLLLSTLGIFVLLYNCLPMIGPVICFLPLWTIYLGIKGSRFFRFPEDKNSLAITILSICILGGPISVFYIFDLILGV